ncbi:GNAT family N-acetyltransferase [Actinoplanes sp. NPDC051861]|uniref:GNAT family N-acetyltransferase n=1 Tax=Actinoplanes sp. NPDC051861 TaxID=3155170 RepID=UPI0034369F88
MTSDTTVIIRTYQPDDQRAVLDLNAYGLAAAGVPADVDVYKGDLEDVAATYLTGRSTLLVVVLAGAVIAMGALQEVDAMTCEITRMRVAPEHQGHGHGKAVLHALESQARRFGFRYAVLLTGPDQHPAVDLYRAAGYVTTAFERHGALTGVRMRKQLD